MKILLLGDTHGNPYAIEYAFGVALNYGCDKIFQLGDYGFWEHMHGGPEFLQVTSELATLNNIPFYWLDGNHENHVMLRQTYYANPAIDGMWQIRPNLYYSPRGNRFSWDGVDFMTMGGAFSIDRGQRKIGKSFWFEEEITDEDIDRGIGDWPTPVNILLSHDLPDGVDLGRIISRRGVNYRVIREAQAGRDKLRRLVDTVRPTHVFHGHYHVRYNETVDFGYGPVRVAGLDCDGSESDSWTIIETQDFRLANSL
jgi:hypothetical protein